MPHPPCSLSSFDKRAVWFAYGDLEQFSYESKESFEEDFSQAIENIKAVSYTHLLEDYL